VWNEASVNESQNLLFLLSSAWLCGYTLKQPASSDICTSLKGKPGILIVASLTVGQLPHFLSKSVSFPQGPAAIVVIQEHPADRNIASVLLDDDH